MTNPQQLDERFRTVLATLPAGALTGTATPFGDTDLSAGVALRLYDAQVASRQLDGAARWLRGLGRGFYTIGSAGHEGNAAVAAALRPTDPVLPHYRSGAFYCARAFAADPAADAALIAVDPASIDPAVGAAPIGADPATGPSTGPSGGASIGPPTGASIGPPTGWTTPAVDPVRDILRGLVASAQEPLAGGRHKVFGNAGLHVIPTTSTIASHLPRAVGLAFAVDRARRVATPTGPHWPRDAVVMASFGDASANHATATAALNTAGWCAHAGLPLPLLLVCEDNGLGISVPSPRGWIEAALRSRPGVRYFAADGCDLLDTYRAAVAAVGWVRRHRRPAVLHLSMVRLMGHAGADAETAYRPAADIAADAARDPLTVTARLLAGAGVATPAELLRRYDSIGRRVREIAEQVLIEPRLSSGTEVAATVAPRRPIRVSRAVAATASGSAGRRSARAALFDGRLPEDAGTLTLAQSINATLTDALLAYPNMLIFGEDVAVKGGVYGVTKNLRERAGAHRVFDTLLDETSILGLGLGAGLRGMLPVPEIQYLAYLHSAGDQLRGEAATMQFFSGRAYRNPMVVRVPGLAYQEGFGGHFHNDNAVGALRDIPGLVLACPARPDDAAGMLRTCLAAAQVDGTVSVLLEPIALYHVRDLGDGDGRWAAPYQAPDAWAAGHVPIGRARVHVVGSGEDMTIITFGNGLRMSLRVAERLAGHGVGTRVVDLRWLAPLPAGDLAREAAATGRVLVVDETRRSGGVGEGVLATLADAGYAGILRRLSSNDSFIPLGPAAQHVLVTEPAIEREAWELLGR